MTRENATRAPGLVAIWQTMTLVNGRVMRGASAMTTCTPFTEPTRCTPLLVSVQSIAIEETALGMFFA